MADQDVLTTAVRLGTSVDALAALAAHLRLETEQLPADPAVRALLATIADERGYARVEWSVLDWNAPSIAFYRSLGAEPMDGWTVFRLTGPALRRAAEIG
jgi:hypothetical protein